MATRQDGSAPSVVQYLVKGQQVFVAGDLTTRVYQRRDGQSLVSLDVRISEVELVGSSKKAEKGQSPKNVETTTPVPEAVAAGEGDNGDLPF